MEETNIGNLHKDWKMSTEDRLVFWKLLCGLNSENMLDDSQKIKDVIKYPRFLYRYRSVNNNNTLAALIDNKLFFLRQITMTILLIHFYESIKIRLLCMLNRI